MAADSASVFASVGVCSVRLLQLQATVSTVCLVLLKNNNNNNILSVKITQFISHNLIVVAISENVCIKYHCY